MTIFLPPLPSLRFIIWTAVVGTVLFLISFPIVALILFIIHLKRTKKEKWSRTCSNDEQAQRDMYDIGMLWYNENVSRKTELHIVNEGLNLFGEYYDFGYDRAVIIVPGRTESLRYGYYFAKPYVESGYNLLVIDQRAHGDSDGKYNTVGFDEHRDVIAWAGYLHDCFGVRSVVLHGICIGASCALFAMTAPHTPDYLTAMVAEGMYPTFYDSFKNHMIALKKPTFPFMAFINLWMRLCTGYSMKHGPIHVIHDYKKPLLMLHGKEDLYSLPSTAKTLYESAGSESKELVWFEKGAHSQLRYADSEAYDQAIKAFLATLPDEERAEEPAVATKES